MAYKRLISYFDLIENEQKRGNAGFVKWEKYDECHILSVFVSGLEEDYSKEAKVYLDDGVLGMLSVRGGRAEGTYLLTGEDKEQKETVEKIKIVLDDTRVLVAEFEVRGKAPMQEAPRVQEKILVQKAPHVQEKILVQEETQEQEKISVQEESQAQEMISVKKDEPVLEAPIEKTEQKKEPAWIGDSEKKTTVGLWERLGETRETFAPFDNEVECFRVFPKDLNLLQEAYRTFQNNQFLMHGYYNYRYLIIFRKKDETDEYWLGVPGIYHEREKMAARMFGFEKFEAINKDYRTGDLGYYLVTVK